MSSLQQHEVGKNEYGSLLGLKLFANWDDFQAANTVSADNS